ncbi:hypothetical protein AB0F30_33380 [Streptomyces sp. NPDC029006]|uniref:hypothetical protein n=1 Tax=Streptomyces sp. NPDC029006 TaxID=3155467 RepID=UPI00340D7F56
MRNRSAAMPTPASAHPRQRGYALAQANRPTERTALKNITQQTATAPDLLTLFDSILTAHDTGDQHGLSLMGHAVARLAGGAA